MNIQVVVNTALQTFGGLVSLIIILCLVVYREKQSRLDKLYIDMLQCNIFLQIANISSWLFDGWQGIWGGLLVRSSNLFMFLLSFMLIGTFINYFAEYIRERDGVVIKELRICWMIICIGIIFLLISQFVPLYYFIDGNNVYQRGDFYWLSNAIGMAAMLPGVWMVIKFRHILSIKEKIAFSAYYVLPMAAAVSHIFIYGAVSLHVVNTLVVVCIYILIQAEQANQLNEKELEIERIHTTIMEKELELQKSRISIMLSQIQPHFLYNSLTGIKDLCDTDPEMASIALEHFAFFLRGNLDSLADTRLIPFRKEIEHVKDYLYLEKVRFEEKLNVEWSLEYMDFRLPPLTLQPIVENAVRYGITKKKGGGTLVIQSRKIGNDVVIDIKDDGVGFDVYKTKSDGRTHIGIDNVRDRLAMQCEGSLLIESERGAGTKAKIILPQRETDTYENDCC
ncbi:sensor histidine kinase [uncultured Robinsoniella sp.]|uniref:sensor histidine kinase n=1 Tax=uncultured Robinsoniella sp. TaxID=904190 RepID=UPI00374F5A25